MVGAIEEVEAEAEAKRPPTPDQGCPTPYLDSWGPWSMEDSAVAGGARSRSDSGHLLAKRPRPVETG